jgi:BirA family biotin operon repressor/biotin-[acetyl-CoA-carboxylase] ligase
LKDKILKFLKEKEGFTSGQSIAEKLNITRNAVNKHIKSLKALGYSIESKHSYGYKLIDDLNFINSSSLQEELKGHVLFKKIIHLKSTRSTNAEAYRLAERGSYEGTVILSELQTHGKGRMGKNWESSGKNNLYFSIILRPKILPSSAPIFTVLSALAVSEAIETTCNIKPKIKWPNDIFIDGKKVCGILTEMKSESDVIDFLIIGIGINVNSTSSDFSKRLIQSTTTLRDVMMRAVSREKLLENIILNIEKWYNILLKGNDSLKITGEWNRRSYLSGKMVTVTNVNEKITGKALGIDENGFLLVKKGGLTKRIFSGTIEKVV